MGKLHGELVALDGQIKGTLSLTMPVLKGTLSFTSIETSDVPTYEGETIVVPKAHDDVVLYTAGTKLDVDIVVLNIPMYETSNPAGGTTVYIGNE